ncbi:uncharacterized protein CDV56_108443 [Aspergillus thermomutatus]|uniref:D-lactate dehydrogenase (cytochrome) n=1 Tax=Aspergillus thermomutatus TaxID=41047 RepID=A0A397HDL4_ASPTH|nr:uncharacterized protein CDV56_108443 [Aspergillus thermomutatus]RHZ60128.1 hypothetical protein CDV56_108443 [Aspergillus thermomutatus]
MSVSTRHNQRARKRTKTFTGCWTCRTRKIKCDEAKPSCRQCHEKGLVCDGYGARLQWLTPGTDRESLLPEVPPAVSGAQSLRRLIPTEPPQSVLAWSEVDSILRYIDSLESVVTASPGENVNAHIHNFGAFSVRQKYPSKFSLSAALDPKGTKPPKAKQTRQEADAAFPYEDPTTADVTPPYDSEAEAAWDLRNLHGHPFPLGFLTEQHDLDASAISPLLTTPHVVTHLPCYEESIQDADCYTPEGPGITPDLLPEEVRVAIRSPLARSHETLVVPTHERLLMEHYRNRVVNLFCVIDNAKSPWKNIHLPRVLQCAGEISFGGSTTRIHAQKWGTIASRYRCDAIGLLKSAIESDLHGEERPKYKEFLATTLSMITINVMSGDTSTCSVHLDGAEKLITYMSARKSRFSRKAQSLHRIYLYLRVIYESTAVRRLSGDSSRFSPSLGSRSTVGPQPPIGREHLLLADDETPSSMAHMNAGELFSYECIYGIPQSLLLLLKASIELIDEVNHERAKTGNFCISDPLNQLCNDLERETLDWPLEERLRRLRGDGNSNDISANIIYHQTRAFLNSLIIYFSQSIRLLGFRYLRQYVQAILDSIEAIEQIKAETKILAAPLFWPAFIGATEAFEPRQQERFRQWYDRVEMYGITAVRTGIQVVQQVWRQGPTTARQKQCTWRIMLYDWIWEAQLGRQGHPQPSHVHPSTKSGRRTSGFLAAVVVAGVVGYSIAGLSRPTTTATEDRDKVPTILDEQKLPDVRYATLEEMHQAIAEIETELGEFDDMISTDDEDLRMHGFAEWSSVRVDSLPVAVAYPRSTDHVSAIARICHRWRVPIIPYSGGSSLEGHTAAPFGGISMDFVHMDKIVKLNEDDMDVVVQPSVQWVDLNEHLKKMGTGFFFPIDPAPSAKIGGMISTNCSGTMRDWVINLTVVLADGSVIKTRRRPRKCSAGYNLNGLFVGAEGTLGIITEATLKLAVVPEHSSVAIVPFPSMRDPVSAAAAVIRSGTQVAALELMDEAQMLIVNESGVMCLRVWREQPTLFFKFSGSPVAVQDNTESVRRIVGAFVVGEEGVALFAACAVQGGEELWNTDVAVPLSRLADIIEASKEEAAALGLNACIKGHVGDSNFHENITYDGTKPEEYEKARAAVKNMVQRALDMDGTCTGEHGIGFGKKDALRWEVGDATLTLMKVLKGALDPNWIMNPGKIFDRQ